MQNSLNNYVHGEIYKVKTSELTPDKDQARRFFSVQAAEDLKTTVAEVGILHAIIVTQVDGALQIVSGERRWRAAKELNWEHVEVKYMDKSTAEISFIENMQRENLLPVEKAEALDRFKKKHEHSHAELARLIGKSVSTVSEILSLNDLTDDIKAKCLSDKRYSHSRLLEISKSPTASMPKMFKSYQNELDGKKFKTKKINSKEKLNGLINRLTGIITQIGEFETTSLDKNDLNKLFQKLSDMRSNIQEKLNNIEQLCTSEVRNEVRIIDEQGTEQGAHLTFAESRPIRNTSELEVDYDSMTADDFMNAGR